MGLLEFVASLFFYVWIAASIFWGTVGAALAIRIGLDVRIAVPISMFFHLLGVFGLWIFHIARKHDAVGNSAQKSSEYTFQTSSWGELNSSTSFQNTMNFDWSSDQTSGSAVPVAAVRTNTRRSWLLTNQGAIVLYGSFLLVLTSVWSLFLTWFNIITPNGSQGVIYGFSTGFDFWTFVTVGALIAAVFLNLRGPSLISALLFSFLGTWWLLLAMASLTARDVFVLAVDKLFQIPNLVVNRGDYSATWAFDVGTAWYVVLVNSVLLISACVWIITQAARDQRT